MPYVEPKTHAETMSSVAFVKSSVLSPLSALTTGPSIDNGPMQYKRMAVVSPVASGV